MKSIKFSEDYTKLPLIWKGTQAKLIAVYGEDVEYIKNGLPAFHKYDTTTRDGRQYPLNFKDALILVFIHLNSGLPFTTIRRDYKEKFEYYASAIGEIFVLEPSSQFRIKKVEE